MIMFVFIVVLGAIAVGIVYILTLQNTLKLIRVQNRKMDPGQVWLVLIPIFGIVWNLIIARRLSDSIYAEFTSRGLPCDKEPTYNLGLAFSILGCFMPFNRFLGPLGTFIAIIGLIIWIIYWVKVSDYKRQIEILPPFQDNDSLIFK